MQNLFATLLVLCLAVAGCVLPSGDDRFPAHDESKAQEYPNVENLVVRGRLHGEGTHVTLNASATNEGPHTYKVSSICAPSWSDSMVSSLGEVHRTEPMAYCAAFGLKEFKPGEKQFFEAMWNGTLWDSQKQGYVDATSGKYTWHLAFHAYKGGKESYEFETQDTIKLQFTATIA